MKRVFDIVASGLGLIVLSPLFLMLAIWIKLDSKGPAFYRQVRVGRYNKDFRIFKFRSMRVGADKGSLVTIGGRDSRVTKSGYWIRKFKLDELPQLINVFIGDMSLVGPRPEVRHYVNYWTPEQMHVLDVRPGITDPASIKFRNENELMEKAEDPEKYYIEVIMQKKIKLYLEYVEKHNFFYDLGLIFQDILGYREGEIEKVRKDNIIDAFFALVRSGLWETEVKLSSFGEIDYETILRISQEQSVIGLVAAGLEHVTDVKVPQKWALQFAGETIQLEKRNSGMNRFIADLITKMKRAGIYTLLVKGQGVAQCYSRPLWRACGDVDFYLSEDNFKKAKAYLHPLSSSTEDNHSGKHEEMIIDSWVVELHGWLRCGISSRINKVLDDIHKETFYEGNVSSWNNNGVQVFMLSNENDVFYVFTHFLNHFYKGGIGLRQICDWCRLIWTCKESLNVTIVENKVRAAGLMTEWKAFGAFAVDYLGMPAEAMPFYSPESKWKKKAERLSAFILEVGNFGHNRDNSYYNKFPYIIRKGYSLGRRMNDLLRHAKIFPLDSFMFLPYVLYIGLKNTYLGD